MTRDESDDIFWSPCGGVCVHQFDRMIFWSSCGGVLIHQVLLYGDGDGADVRSYCRVRRWSG